MNDPWERLDDILQATDDAQVLAARGRSAFDADPLLVRSATLDLPELARTVREFRDNNAARETF